MVAMTSQFTALMYVCVFAAGLKLVADHFLGKLMCVCGIVSCSLGFMVGVFAPSELKLVTTHEYSLLLIIGDVVLIVLGLYLVERMMREQALNI
jgi:Flp pilus assembly protein TadB